MFRTRFFGSHIVALLLTVLHPASLPAIELVSGVDDPALLSASANGKSDYLSMSAVSTTGRHVAFTSIAANLVAGDTNKIEDVFVRDLQAGTTACASCDSSGNFGNGESRWAAISGNGRYAAFESFADNLVPGDTNSTLDIFVKDLQTGTIVRASTSSSGEEGDSSSRRPVISDDGRYVAFESYADNLDGSNYTYSNGIFVKDLQTGSITRASSNSNGDRSNKSASYPSISSDGRYVVFESSADNLVAGDTNTTKDIFLKDLQTGLTRRVSTDSAEVEADARSDDATISGNGRYVSFTGDATNLVAGDTNGERDVFVKDLQTGVTSRVSTDESDGQADNFSYNRGISDDGRYIVIDTAATNLIAADPGYGIILKDRQTGATLRINADAAGVRVAGPDEPSLSGDGSLVAFRSSIEHVADDGNGVPDIFMKNPQSGSVTLVSARDPAITGYFSASGDSINRTFSTSSDGRYVAFYSDAPNLVPGDTNGFDDAFVRDMQSGATMRVSTDSSGTEAEDAAFSPSISGDGRYVVFSSSSTNLVPNDTNNSIDIFLKDIQTGTTTLVSTDGSGQQPTDHNQTPVISGDGRWVAFHSYSSTLDGGPNDFHGHIYAKDLQTGTVLKASTDATGTPANDGSSFYPAISADGRIVAFSSWATNLVPGDTNGHTDVFVKDLQTGAISRANTDSTGVEADDSSGSPALSSDGRYVAFWSKAGNLAPGAIAGKGEVYVRDLQAGTTTLIGHLGSSSISIGLSSGPAISGDGRYVVFRSYENDLVAADTNGKADIFMKDLQTGYLNRVNRGSAGEEGNGESGSPAISSDGRYVIFTSTADNLVLYDGNSDKDVFSVDTTQLPPPLAVLDMRKSPSFGGTTNPPRGQHTVEQGTAVSITATPAAGYNFSGWVADPAANASFGDPSAAATTVTLAGNTRVTANFSATISIPVTLTMECDPDDGGTTSPSAGTHTVDQGVTTTIAATAAPGYIFSGWAASPSSNATFGNSLSATTTVTLADDARVIAIFEPPPITEFTSPSGELFIPELHLAPTRAYQVVLVRLNEPGYVFKLESYQKIPATLNPAGTFNLKTGLLDLIAVQVDNSPTTWHVQMQKREGTFIFDLIKANKN